MTPETATEAVPRRTYRYYDLVTACSVTVRLCANVIGAAQICPFTLVRGLIYRSLPPSDPLKL